jgi:hypothetical protein
VNVYIHLVVAPIDMCEYITRIPRLGDNKQVLMLVWQALANIGAEFIHGEQSGYRHIYRFYRHALPLLLTRPSLFSCLSLTFPSAVKCLTDSGTQLSADKVGPSKSTSGYMILPGVGLAWCRFLQL